MEKYGFVYIWFDRKHKRYYIGCRWGNENDGYICSSTHMKRAYKRRSDDFKRRILARVYNRKQLLEEEYKWLKLTKSEELGKRYYNLHNHHFGHWSHRENNITIIEKMQTSLKKTYSKMSDEERKNKFGKQKGKTSLRKGLTLEQEYGKEKAEEIRQKIKEKRATQTNTNSKALKGRPSPNKGKKLNVSEQSRINMGWSKGLKLGNRLSEEAKLNIGKKNSKNLKKLWQNPEYREKMLTSRGKKSQNLNETC